MKNKHRCRSISFMLIICMLFSAFPTGAFADETNDKPKVGYVDIKGVPKSEYYYDDDYFSESGKVYNEHLAAMSLNLELAVCEKRNTDVISNLFDEIGFTNVVTDELEDHPTQRTIGTAIASKKIGKTNVIAVAIRGDGYENEWASNVLVGKDGNALGFETASLKVVDRIRKYIKNNNLKNNKYWIVGYSRAGAVADLTGVYLNKHLNVFDTNTDDLYVYTFSAPAGSDENVVYDNIYNVININDIVPFTYPEAWGLYSNGKRIEIAVSSNVMTYTMPTLFSNEENEYKETSVFLNEFFSWFTSQLSREKYAETVQIPLSAIMDIYFMKSEEGRSEIVDFIKNDFYPLLRDDEAFKEDMQLSLDEISEKNSDCVYQLLADRINKMLDKLYKNGELKEINLLELKVIESSIYPIVRTLGPIFVSDYIYYEGIDYDKYYEEEKPLYNASDYDWGYSKGEKAGEKQGYEYGIDPAHADMGSISQKPDVNYNKDYKDGYKEGAKAGYENGFKKAKSHLENLGERGYYDCYTEAERLESGLDDNNTVTAEKSLEDKGIEDWMTDEYKSEYSRGYNEKVEENKRSLLNDDGTKRRKLPCYHIISFFKNMTPIITNHYTQVNLAIVQMKDSYYTSSTSTLMLGDVDFDNKITSADSLLQLRASVGLENFNDFQWVIGDVDRNSEITSYDALLTLRASVNLEKGTTIGTVLDEKNIES